MAPDGLSHGHCSGAAWQRERFVTTVPGGRALSMMLMERLAGTLHERILAGRLQAALDDRFLVCALP